ncbi:hypothetical protein ES319_D02G019300v1 [Gossypium barbadense]|uniref:Uncharacterized protein n=2 Tax=Gossypium TaxID=3633 RepID=A0A5J5S832_GOSBA|nr:hypothetical protein ES319_1Z007400v1 [Gossypium barbadense]KAB1669826.1 hypothetical protein ES319_1Z007400v1 [Gossypium barbadense]KAB2039575.1 hypothetical protein ES319_D02G019300v1 [Gossypium barbadense]KAB2039576.1 hypothetical protein ES319_D02G019300v1 [Gossypium barbadense]TYG77961.1 hypothetical protein ES288_D02G018100v1 [Gossypium darwinii]
MLKPKAAMAVFPYTFWPKNSMISSSVGENLKPYNKVGRILWWSKRSRFTLIS